MSGTLLRQHLPRVLLVAVLFAVLSPLFYIVRTAVTADGVWAFDTYGNVLSRPSVQRALVNTFVYVVASVPLSVIIGLALAMVSSRLQSRLVRIVPVFSLLMPPVVGAMGWVLLFAPRSGLFNVVWRAIVGSDAVVGPLNIFTVPGIIAASTVFSVPFTYLFALSALDNLDPSIEEAARMSGARPLKTFRTVVVPVIRPGVSSAVLLTTLLTLSEFSIPMIIGRQFDFWVITMEIWRSGADFPRDYAVASVLGSLLIVIAVTGLLLQRWSLSKGSFATITGKSQRSRAPFTGRAKFFALSFVWLYAIVTIVGPIVALFIVSVQPFWTPGIDWQSITLNAYTSNLSIGSGAYQAFRNSFLLAVPAATLTVLLAGFGSYVIVRRRDWTSRLMDFAYMAPASLPNTLLGLGFLLFFLFGPVQIYGRIWALVGVYVVLYLPHASRASIATIHQVSPDLEEASYMSGVSWVRTLRSITFPLARPGLKSAWLLVFILSFRELSASIFLTSRRTPVVSTFLVERWEFGVIPDVAATGLTVVVLSGAIVAFMNRSKSHDLTGRG